jgi:hypothetical protein
MSKARITPKVRATLKARTTLKVRITPKARGIVLLANAFIIDATRDIGATAFSIGLGNTAKDLADQRSPIQRGTLVGQ